MQPKLLILAGLICTLFFTGCSTFESRSEEKASVFNSLDPAVRERLKNRLIEVGDTEDMVYIALGAPDEKRETATKDGRATTWVYNAYWQEYRGEQFVGYRRSVIYDPKAKTYRVYYEPIERSVYQNRVEERIRVTFRDGRVTVVEQVKP